MSIQAVNAVIENSKSEGPAFTLMLIIATHANDETFTCYPSRETLCRETRIKCERTLIRHLNALEASGEVITQRGNGRGNLTTYTVNLPIKKGDKLSLKDDKSVSAFSKAERVTSEAERVTKTSERVTKQPLKGDKTSCAYKDIEPSGTIKEPSGEPLEDAAARVARSPKSKTSSRQPDPRSTHPAIQACRRIAKAFPPLEIYDRLIAILGDTPDETYLESCRAEWRERGHNPVSWKWATEWYAEGIPARQNGRASPHQPQTVGQWEAQNEQKSREAKKLLGFK